MFQVNQRWWAEEGESRSVLADAKFYLSEDEINATKLKKGLGLRYTMRKLFEWCKQWDTQLRKPKGCAMEEEC